MTDTINVRQLRENLSARLDAAEAGEYTVITRDGQPTAALIPIDVFKTIEDAEDELLARKADDAWEAEKDQPRVSMAELIADMFGEQAAG
ncbi:type II toxin-antitoxin system prevent-host-death family antitoxin [Nocardia sp. SYP-A9097]|uniref:type II toxin-antitoxin system Phd/YefM family antitoxin n=1 Tax=Nocardia sp. SYP-A9097 TaxID=2663237 RepID=UPI00129B6EB0|nr:type II toxin-antitoxin system Phd/YefM family antitoxin [Nocardia sp. SYP-A9097]MRH86164.1 type II toxin-antitoxin system prevent-host-death family antitoxin [Nocardia sp. SYP-A9097]